MHGYPSQTYIPSRCWCYASEIIDMHIPNLWGGWGVYKPYPNNQNWSFFEIVAIFSEFLAPFSVVFEDVLKRFFFPKFMVLFLKFLGLFPTFVVFWVKKKNLELFVTFLNIWSSHPPTPHFKPKVTPLLLCFKKDAIKHTNSGVVYEDGSKQGQQQTLNTPQQQWQNVLKWN